MRKRLHEIMGVPPEFHEDGPPEHPNPPDEYNRFAPIEEPAKRDRSRLMRTMLLLAASGLTVLGVLLSRSAIRVEAEEPTATPTATAVPAATSAPETPTMPAVVEAPTPAPTDTPAIEPIVETTETPTPEPMPTPSPSPTPEPSPVVEPGVEITYYRMSEVYEIIVQWNMPEQMESIIIRLNEPYIGTIWEHELDAEERSFGYYRQDNFDLYNYIYSNDFDLSNVPPNYDLNPLLEVAYAYSGENGLSDVVSAEAVQEMWVGVHYDNPNPEEDIYATFYGETTYPDCFVVRIEEWMTYDGLQIFYGKQENLEPGDVCVTVTVDGQDIPADTCRLVLEPHEYGDQVYYSYAFVMPRPETFPEHGTAHVTLTQKLLHYNTSNTKLRDITY